MRSLTVIGTSLLLQTLAQSAENQFDFNSLNIGDLNNQIDDSPNTIGRWSTASAVPEVVAGDLAPPPSTNYSFAAGGTSQRLQITRADDKFRAQFHQIEPINGGVIWTSALLKAEDLSAAAVAFDGANEPSVFGYTLRERPGFGLRPNAGAGTTEFFWSDNLQDLTNNQAITVQNDFSSQAVLVLARIDLDASASNVSIWINPTLSTIGDLGTADLTATTSVESVSWIGIGAVDTGLSSYQVEIDNFLLDSDSQEYLSFANVTGLSPVSTPQKISLQYDFNDLTPGAIINQVDDSMDDIGTWTGTSFVPQVSPGNLTAPASTNYGYASNGTSGKLSLTRSDNAYRAGFHRTSPASDVMWFSALINADDSSAAAISIDGAGNDLDLSGKAGFGIRPNSAANTTELFWSDDLTNLASNQAAVISTDYSGTTVLLVGRIDFQAATNQIDIWINPTISDRSALGTTGDLEATTSRTSMEWIGAGTVNNGSDGYSVSFDNILFNNSTDEDTAFNAVAPLLPPPPEPAFATADINANGLPDHAELLYPEISRLPLTTDSDGDGTSNQTEAIAGTDPFDPNSNFLITAFAPSGTNRMEFQSVEGKRYQTEASESLEAGSWTPFGSVLTGTGGLSEITWSPEDFGSSDKSFLRIKILPDLDSDDDGLEDALEAYLAYSPTASDSVRSLSSGGDLQQFTNLMIGGNPSGGMAGTLLAGIPSDENASRFLAQASWGPTTDSITELQALGPDAYLKWIDQQLATPASHTRTYMDYLAGRRTTDYDADWDSLPHYIVGNSNFAFYRENLNSGWMRIMLFGDDQLRQRTAWALSQIVPIGPRCNSYALAAADWYDIVIRHSFGNYRDLLYDVSVHPWMGWWLSHIDNEKATQVATSPDGGPVYQMPDENFAREIMQLFSIGLWQLNLDGSRMLDGEGNPVPTYTNEDIAQVARVFTGLKGQPGIFGREMYSTFPMHMDDSVHDDGNDTLAAVYQKTIDGVPEPLSEAGKKRFLGHELPRFQDEPGRTGLDDVSDAVDIFFNHPSCPPFVCRNLIQHLVTSNPTPDYLERVSKVFVDDGTGTRGNMAAVVKAILLDPEARNPAFILDPASGRLKGPVLRTVHMARATNAGSSSPALFDDTGIQFWDPIKGDMFADYLEFPFESPSVFNFYEPGYSRPGEIRENDLLSPEFQIMNSLTTTTIPNRLLYFIENGLHRDSKDPGVTPDFNLKMEALESLSNSGTEDLVDHLNLIFAHGSIGAEARSELINRINFYANNPSNADDRAELALYLSIISAEGSVLK